MTYQEVRQHYPETWLLLEALHGRSEGEYRILEDVAVLASFAESFAALVAYRQFKATDPNRELYVVHSTKPELQIKERQWLGIRSAA